MLLPAMFDISSDWGRIGPFWWVNGVQSVIELQNAVWEGSIHHVWRPGICGIDPWFPPRHFEWRFVRATIQEG
jgi:hypothetical protein